jgi:hypothetical protein
MSNAPFKTMTTLDDILNPVHMENLKAVEGLLACDHALSIIDEHLARLAVDSDRPDDRNLLEEENQPRRDP